MPFKPGAGGCACGRIRYDLVADPLTLYACHCTDCQTETGASFTLSMIVTRDSVVLTTGEPRLRQYTLPDGRERRSYRCSVCDVSLWHMPRRFPDLLNLQPGTLDDTSWLHPVAHIWTRSRQPWIVLPPNVLSYDQQPHDPGALVSAWKERSS
jgi:hypothetical protein